MELGQQPYFRAVVPAPIIKVRRPEERKWWNLPKNPGKVPPLPYEESRQTRRRRERRALKVVMAAQRRETRINRRKSGE